jgi:dihydrofolate reductase
MRSAAEEDGGLSFVSGEPFSETTNPAFKARVMGFIDSVDTLILGANTDEQGEYGEKLNNLTKFVASSKLDDAPWGDFPAATVTRAPVATIRELKEQSGKDIWLWGSLNSCTPCWTPASSTRSPCSSARRHAARERAFSRIGKT